MDMTPEEIKSKIKDWYKKHKHPITWTLRNQTGFSLDEVVELFVGLREYGELKQSPPSQDTLDYEKLVAVLSTEFDLMEHPWEDDVNGIDRVISFLRTNLKQSPPPELDAQKMEELRDELDNITDIDKLRDLVVEKKVASLFYARGCLEKHAQILELQRREKQSPRWVKASERLPNAHEAIPIKVTNDNGVVKYDTASLNPFTKNFCGRLYTYDMKYVEWLDESESPGSQEAVEWKDVMGNSLSKTCAIEVIGKNGHTYRGGYYVENDKVCIIFPNGETRTYDLEEYFIRYRVINSSKPNNQ